MHNRRNPKKQRTPKRPVSEGQFRIHKPSARKPERSNAPAVHAAPRGGMIYLFGVHAVVAAWCNPLRVCRRLLVSENGRKQIEGALRQAAGLKLHRPQPEVVDPRMLDKLAGAGAVHQGIVLEAEPLPEIELDDLLESENPPALLVMLDQVTDPHNVGAILRTACAFNAGAVLMTERHAAAATGTLAKIASGALEHTPLVRVPNLSQVLGKLQKAGYWCIGLDETGERALHEIKMAERTVLVMGAEGEGLRRLTRESCDEIAKLPTQPPIGSLNVSNAAAVAIYEFRRQRP